MDTVDAKVVVSITAEAHDTVKAFFKAYAALSPKMEKVKSKANLALVEEATDMLNKLSRALGALPAKKKGKKSGFTNVTHAPKKERMNNIK